MTSALELGYHEILLPGGERVWFPPANGIVKAASYASQATATRSLEELARQLDGAGLGNSQGPGLPMTPLHQDQTQPRRWAFPAGYNISTRPRGYEVYSFDALRQLTYNYDVARLCIEERKARIRRLKWHIQAKPVADMKRADAKSRSADLAANVQKVTGFFLSPDQRVDFTTWLMEWLELTFSVDAACIYRRPTEAGDLYGLDIVDGVNVKVIIDGYGQVPVAPLPAYDLIIYNTVWNQFTTDELLMRPYWPRPDSPYGHPPIEWIVLNVNRALRRQTADLSLYTEGNVPAGFMKVFEQTPPQQIKEMQEFFDELVAGNDVARSRIRFVPGGPGTGLEMIAPQPTSEAEQALAILTCAAYGVDPKSIGFMTGTGHAMGGKGMEEGIETRGIERDAEICDYLARTLNQVIAEDLGEPELEFVFDGLQQAEDQYSKAQAEDLRLRNGSLGVDEAREDHDLDPVGLNVPYVETSGTVLLVTDIEAVSALEADPPAPPTPAAGGASNLPTANATPGKATNSTAGAGPKATTKAAVDELRAWRRKAIAKGAAVAFRTEALPDDVALTIRKGLGVATTPDAIRAVFAKAGGAPADPFPSPALEPTSKPRSASSSLASGPTRPATSRSGWAL